MAEPALNDPPMSMDEVKESITAKGRERGFVTSEDLLEAVPLTTSPLSRSKSS